MLDTTKLKVEEIKNVLLEEYGVEQEELDSLVGKSNVVAKLRALESLDESILDNAVETDSSNVDDKKETDEEVPEMFDPGWTKYVLSKMRPDELMDGHPTVDGLRRMVDMLLGTVVGLESEVYQTPDENNKMHATVRVRVLIDNGITVDGCADAGGNNCKPMFAIHPVAMAESRAESRAYRRLLRLKNVISAEETINPDEIIDAYESITSAQIKIIDKICSKLDINVEKWLVTKDIKVEDFKKLTKTKGADLCGDLNTLQGSGTVPDDIKGYVFGWEL